MPRKPSDLRQVMFTVDPETLDALTAIALHHGWLNEAGNAKGEPNRSRAVRELAKREARRIKRRKS